jgi:hypothetical protein
MGEAPSVGRNWYSLDLEGGVARFVILDSNVFADPRHRYADSLRDELGEAELAWADSALESPARWKFLVFHHPLASTGHYLRDWERTDQRPLTPRKRLLEMCRRHGVTALLAGHEHLYHLGWIGPAKDDPRGFWQLTTGGAGSPLVQIPAQRRRKARDQILPDSSRVRFTGKERPIYHLCRMVIWRGTSKHEAGVWLYVDQVDASGRRCTIEVHRLDQPPEAL